MGTDGTEAGQQQKNPINSIQDAPFRQLGGGLKLFKDNCSVQRNTSHRNPFNVNTVEANYRLMCPNARLA